VAIVRKRKSLEQSMHIIKGGDEPSVSTDNYKEQLLRALNWYNANRDEKEYRQYAEYYVKHTPTLVGYAYAVAKAPFEEIRAIGAIGRLVRRGQHVAIEDNVRILERLEAIQKKYGKRPKQVKPVATKAVVSVQDRMNEAARLHCAEVDAAIDEFAVNKISDFSLKSYLVTNNVSGPVAKKIGEFYAPLAQELADAVAGKDAQLKDGYSNFSKTHLKRFAAFVKQLVADCSQQVVTSKVARAPRAKKVKPASVVAAKIKPLREFSELGLKSIEPAKIIGASELWTYCPETRKLTVYRAENGSLGVSGMSVTNYSVELSETKTIRKPDAFFRSLSSMGKRAMSNAWKALNAKPSAVRGRITDKVVLLAAN
jgi:hypothetical protein